MLSKIKKVVKKAQIRSNTLEIKQKEYKLQKIESFKSVKTCQNVLILVEKCHKSVKYCQNMSKTVENCQEMPENVKICQEMSRNVKKYSHRSSWNNI